MKRIPKTKEDFAWINWTAEEIEKIPADTLARKRALYERVKSISPNERTFENTIYGIESASDAIPEFNLVEILMQVSPKEDVRKVAELSYKKMQEEFVDIEFDAGLYRAIKEFALTPEAAALTGEDKKLFEDTMRDYRRMGFELPQEQQDNLKETLKKLQKLQTEFVLNINNYQDHILVTREELDGLPENYINGLSKDEASGKYIVSLKAPEFGPFMENATNSAKRKELNDKLLHKGGQANMDLLKDILKLRQMYAEILGYSNFVDYAVENRMAKNGKTIEAFMDDLMIKLQPAKDADLKALHEVKRSMTGNPEAKIEYFDTVYYMQQLEKQLFNFDKEKVREYFPLDVVLNGLFEIYGTLFSVEFEELKDWPVWHPDVKLYVTKNKSDGSVVGYFFMDLYPRDGKYNHPSMWPIINGRRERYNAGDYIVPTSTIIGILPKPTPKLLTLLSHDEVATLFHEFGHIMHGTLTSASFASQSGTSVVWDFVEVPSQMLEHWVWDKDMLNILSGHYKDKTQKLPPEILDSMLRAKNHMVGYIKVRQLVLGLYNHILHAGPVKEDIARMYNDMVVKYFGIPLPDDAIFAAGFGHLIGYAGAYYSYLWSEVFECDLFTRFKSEGLLNPKTGGDYRSWILEKGSSMEPMELIRGFLGREPNNKAFLEELGIKE